MDKLKNIYNFSKEKNVMLCFMPQINVITKQEREF